MNKATQYVIVAGIVTAIAIINGMFAQRDEQIRVEAQRLAEEKKAELFSALIAHCLNGNAMRVADHTVDCIERKGKR